MHPDLDGDGHAADASSRAHLTLSLATLGWNAAHAAAFADLVARHPLGAALVPARVLAAHRDRWITGGDGGERPARLAPRHDVAPGATSGVPTTGDWVAVAPSPQDGEPATIHALLPRASAFVRKVAGGAAVPQVVAANVDLALILAALPHDVNARRVDRWLTLAWESGAEPLLVLSRADLAPDLPAALAAAHAMAPGVRVLAVSTHDGYGLDALRALLAPGRTAVLLGASGAGKSTLANALADGAGLRTGAVRRDGKGRHTTTHRQLVMLPGGAMLIDTPGVRELQLWDADAGLERAFADVTALAEGCRFRDCAHATEPGCAVRAAVEAGTLPVERLESWRDLARELAHLARRVDQRGVAEDRARARVATRALEAHVRRKRG